MPRLLKISKRELMLRRSSVSTFFSFASPKIKKTKGGNPNMLPHALSSPSPHLGYAERFAEWFFKFLNFKPQTAASISLTQGNL
jgi:hypothetical protein